MTVGTNYDVLFLSVWVQTIIVFGGERKSFYILLERSDGSLWAPSRVAACIRDDDVFGIAFHIYIWLLSISVIFNDDARRAVDALADKASTRGSLHIAGLLTA